MEEARHDGQLMTQKNAELKELWATNTVQELRNSSRLCYQTVFCSLHKKMQEDYDVKRAKYIGLIQTDSD